MQFRFLLVCLFSIVVSGANLVRAETVSFDTFPDGTPITVNTLLTGDEFASRGVLLRGAPGGGSYCSGATSTEVFVNAACSLNGLYASLPGDPGGSCQGSEREIEFLELQQTVTITFAAPSANPISAFDDDGVLLGSAIGDCEWQQCDPRCEVTFTSYAANIRRVIFGYQAQLNPIFSVIFESSAPSALEYVALGDSYSSGEGACDYLAGTDTSSNRCHRSENAYSRETNPFVEAVYGMGISVDRTSFFACSGAETKNIKFGGVPRYGEIAQLDHAEIGSSTDLLTITIGGNDAQFADIIKWCMDGDFDCRDYEVFPGWPLRVYLPYIIQNWVEVKLELLFDEIQTAAPNATIVALGYPQLLSSDPGAQNCFSLQSVASDITPDEITFLRTIGDSLNDAISDAASAVGIHFAPVTSHFDGHEVCTDNPWINGIKNQSVWCLFSKRCWNESFHPNELGHWAYSRAAYDYLRAAVNSGEILKPNGLPENPPPQAHTGLKSEILDAPTLGDLNIELVDSPVCGDGHVVFMGQSIRVIGDGFSSGATVEVQMDLAVGAPVLIGTTTADSLGEIDVIVTTPTGVVISQPTTLRATGTGENGYPRLLIETLPVADQPGYDSDLDGVPDACDNCVDNYNPLQEDADFDELGDVCDLCPDDPGNDADGDGLCRDVDPCPYDPLNYIANNGQCIGFDGVFWSDFESGDTSAWSSVTP